MTVSRLSRALVFIVLAGCGGDLQMMAPPGDAAPTIDVPSSSHDTSPPTVDARLPADARPLDSRLPTDAASHGDGREPDAATPEDAPLADVPERPDAAPPDAAIVHIDAQIIHVDAPMIHIDAPVVHPDAVCLPDCNGKACGSNDGCNGICQTGTCGEGSFCVAGSCTCDASSCAGCCSNGACLLGMDHGACGQGGVACAVCSNDTTCTPNGCGQCGGSDEICCFGDDCSAPLSCGGGGMDGVCGCIPSCPQNGVCGASDGCGGNCAGTCNTPPQPSCVDSMTVIVWSQAPGECDFYEGLNSCDYPGFVEDPCEWGCVNGACSTTPPPCMGCIDGNGQCQTPLPPGIAPGAACPTCAGCIQNGVCQPGTTDNACGLGGGQCDNCPAFVTSCPGGGGGSCSAGFTCQLTFLAGPQQTVIDAECGP